ncbi:Apoptotic chromatin condensation inducer in the nucleus [Plakobranchus ocellatus]|uniref:Apoptotic chromatin condensation inducer in the nucleus n=1 Tax=Plakobranchus ocellatus TaxID=259542 RepID=A0AAV3YXA7_9GAST|nr:Apoptotic chromatin condensation inducer in the nucleus [Plakobranchus ocellatus]
MGYYHKVHSWCILVLLFSSWPWTTATNGEEVIVLEYFENMHVSDLNSAQETCRMRKGELAGGELEMDDWDSYLMFSDLEVSPTKHQCGEVLWVHYGGGQEGVLAGGELEMDDWDSYLMFSDLELDKTTGEWKYSNGELVDMTSSRALILREYNSGTGPTQPTYDCALWNPWEPFFIPALCSDDNAFICRLPATVLGLTKKECLKECTKFANLTLGEYPCWAAEYRSNESSSGRIIATLSSEVMKQLPSNDSSLFAVISLKSAPLCDLRRAETVEIATYHANNAHSKKNHIYHVIFGNAPHLEVASFPEDTCSILCKCNTSLEIIVPQTPEEMQRYVERAAAQAKRELYVPTSNLSSTTRKKNSATDERSSSTGMGVLGIVMFVLVFGSLIGLDIINVVVAVKKYFADWKSPQAKTAFVGIEETP